MGCRASWPGHHRQTHVPLLPSLIRWLPNITLPYSSLQLQPKREWKMHIPAHPGAHLSQAEPPVPLVSPSGRGELAGPEVTAW